MFIKCIRDQLVTSATFKVKGKQPFTDLAYTLLNWVKIFRLAVVQYFFLIDGNFNRIGLVLKNIIKSYLKSGQIVKLTEK